MDKLHVCTALGVGLDLDLEWLGLCGPQLTEGISSLEEVKDMCRLLEFLATEMAANRNFELVQAILHVTMQVRPMRRNPAHPLCLGLLLRRRMIWESS